MRDVSREISDQAFIAQFENLTLDPVYFDHVGHLRLTWLYLNQYALDVSIQKVCKGINAYATHLGAPDKFHVTITQAMVRLVAARMQPQERSWQYFLANNQDIVENALSVLCRDYTKERLLSEEARHVWLEPDLV